MTQAQIYQITSSLRPYVYEALLIMDGDHCNVCKETHASYDIDHLRYASDITIKDLQLLCYDCHKAKTMASNDIWLSKISHCSTCTCN
jgi:hypothetical protein